MKFVAQRLRWSGMLFLACSVLLLPLLCYVARWYIDNNLRQFGLSLLGWDSCFFPMVLGAMFELVATGLTVLVIAALIRLADHLRVKNSN